MSLQLAAQHMASRGRGPDTQLVHMAPQEVAGLQALAMAHGGTLTINPDTGLAEAGFLSKMLPTLIGVGLSVASGGALTPLMAAGITGAGYGLATGSLKKGLMAGLGAYGGAGLAGSLATAGTTAGLNAATTEATLAGNTAGNAALTEATAAQTATNAANTAAEYGTFNATPNQFSAFGDAPGSFTAPATPMPVTPSPLQVSGGIKDISVQKMLDAGFTPDQIAQNAKEFASNQAGTAASPFTAKTQEMLANPLSTGFNEPNSLMNRGNLGYGLSALSPLLIPDEQKFGERAKDDPEYYSFDAGYQGGPDAKGNYFAPKLSRINTKTPVAAGGGLMDLGSIQAMSDRNMAQSMMANGGQGYAEGGTAVQPVENDPFYTMSGPSADAFKYLMGERASSLPTAMSAAPQSTAASTTASTTGTGSSTDLPMFSYDPTTGKLINVGSRANPMAPASYFDIGMAQGGLSAISMAQGGYNLGDYSDGGRLLRGPGDGVSDDIPATIADKRPARLADGEFVVPARIVSELGNGSTEAGARQLYAMMSRVQNARKKSIGKDRVAVNSRTEKMLPA